MEKLNKYSGVIAIVAVLIAIFVWNSKTNTFGGTRFPQGLSADSTSPNAGQVRGTTLTITGASTLSSLILGSGTTISEFNAGTCYIRPYAATIAASSTATVDCQATQNWDAVAGDTLGALGGVANNDWVVAKLSTTTAGTVFNGLSLIGASASSTAGIITLRISNLTGGTYTWSTTAGTASGTASYISGN